MKDARRLFAALADGNRLRILFLLAKREMYVSEIARRLSLSQPAVSHHLAVLKNTSLVHSQRHGKRTLYSINSRMLNDLLDYIAGKFSGGDREN
ncbi:MAG: metalloregulator ArsR/SmtB family transcription factor [bacterium]